MANKLGVNLILRTYQSAFKQFSDEGTSDSLASGRQKCYHLSHRQKASSLRESQAEGTLNLRVIWKGIDGSFGLVD